MSSASKGGPTPNRIREVRQAQGMSLQELGDKAGMHYTTVAKLERSQRGLKLNYLASISAALGVKPIDLIGGTPEVLPMRMVPLVTGVSDGDWASAVAENQIGTVPAPLGGSNAFALRPEGDALGLVVTGEAYIIVDPDELDLVDAKIFAMNDRNGKLTFKRFRDAPPRFEPVSGNPEDKVIAVGREPFTTVGRVIWQASEL